MDRTEKDFKLLKCPICEHSWMAHLVKGKIYYQCPNCRAQINLKKIEEKKNESLNTDK